MTSARGRPFAFALAGMVYRFDMNVLGRLLPRRPPQPPSRDRSGDGLLDYQRTATDLGPAVKRLRGGVGPTAPAEKNVASWLAAKPEKNALIAVILEDVWPRVVDRSASLTRQGRAPEELVQRAFSEELEAWASAREDRVKTLSADRRDALDGVYARFRDLLKLGQEVGYVHPEDTVADAIERGVNTATRVTWALFNTAPQLLEANGVPVTRSNLRALVESGYGPVINGFASVHQSALLPLLEKLGGARSRFDPKYFGVERSDRGPKLVFRSERLLADARSSPSARYDVMPAPDALKGVTTRCPAKYAKGPGGKDVVREMFNLNLEIATATVFAKYPP